MNMEGKNPFISVVVLTKNRPEYIKLCLDSILKQEYDGFEVLIVDSASNKKTKDLLHSYESDKVYLYHGNNCSIGMARQIGCNMAKGSIIAYIDSDVELPHEKWLANMVKPFSEFGSIAGVQTLAKTKESDPEILKKVHSSFEYSSTTIDKWHYEPIGTSHILIRKDLIQRVGGFKDISFKEDTDLTYRIMELGYFFKYLPEEKCYHYHVKNYKDCLRKEIRNKYKGLICLLKGIK